MDSIGGCADRGGGASCKAQVQDLYDRPIELVVGRSKHRTWEGGGVENARRRC